jgi:hypothetical protein
VDVRVHLAEKAVHLPNSRASRTRGFPTRQAERIRSGRIHSITLMRRSVTLIFTSRDIAFILIQIVLVIFVFVQVVHSEHHHLVLPSPLLAASS